MAKNLIEFSAYDADVVSYDNYNSTKTVLGPDIFKFSGTTQPDYYISPNETTFRDITQDTGFSNWGDIDVITYQGSKQWIFCLKGFVNNLVTTDVAMYEFDKDTYSYSYIGEIRCSGTDGTSRTHQGIKANLDYYYTGTVEVAGNTVSGTGTNWFEDRIPIGARIGFGSTNSNDITTWYRITDYPLMNNQPSLINAVPSCVAVDPSTGKIYIGGAFTTYNGTTINRIARLNTDGTLDNTFNIGAGFSSNTVTTITIDSSGKIYVGGNFTNYDGVAANRIIKLNSDGTKDTSFDNSTGFNNTVNDIKIDSLGQIWVGGAFTTYKGVSARYLTKLSTDGSLDGTYPNTVNPNTSVRTIAIDSNDDVYIGGDFTQVGAVTNNSKFIAKILKTGGLDTTFVTGVAGANNAFSSNVFTILYKSSTNTIIVGGSFTQWKGGTNQKLTELSATGDALISNAVSAFELIYSMIADSFGNFYTNGQNGLTTKKSLSTLKSDPLFNPNVVFTSNSAANSIALSPTASRVYVCSGNTTVDSGIVCADTSDGTRDVNFLTSQDYKTQVLTISSTASYPAGTPYVVEDLKIFTQRSGVGTMLIQGISIEDFTQTFNSLSAPLFNFMGLSKGIFNIRDASWSSGIYNVNSVNTVTAKDLRILEKENNSTHYLYVVAASGRVSRFNVKSNYITQLGTNATGTLRYSRPTEVIVTAAGVNSLTGASINGFASGKFTIGTLQTGSAAGVKSIYIDVSGVAQTPINDIQNDVAPKYNVMSEIPPGSSETFAAAGNVSRVYLMPKIDRLLILNSSATSKSYITNFRTNLIVPTLAFTLYSRETFDNLSIENSYEIAFLVNGSQLQGNTANINAPRYPDTLGTGFFGAVENGVLHLCRPLNTIQNNLYSIPIECEAEYVNFSNNVFITPKYTLANVLTIKGLYINTQKQYGSYRFALPPEPIEIDYRTTGIDDNSGSWTKYENISQLNSQINNDGVSSNLTIQFRFSFRVAGNTCLTNKIYGFSLVYEDDRTDSHYSPSVTKSSLSNRIFAWRQSESWFGNIPDLKIRLYNSTTNKIVFFDTVSASASGTWEYSTNGITWLAWNSSADNVGNYIRYVADFVPSGIKLRVGLNTA